jgi:hypothetical protein
LGAGSGRAAEPRLGTGIANAMKLDLNEIKKRFRTRSMLAITLE